MRTSRRGFTLIELLVVIGIILILMSIIVIGFRHVNYTSARRETFAELHLCRDVLQEYENTNGLTNINQNVPVQISGPALLPGAPPTPDLFPVYLADPPHSTAPALLHSYVVPADLSALGGGGITDMGDRLPGTARYAAPAVLRTQDVMFILLKDPKNRALISALPPKRLLEGPPQTTGGARSPTDIAYATVLDGWGDPIIFVPAGGLVVSITTNIGNSSSPAVPTYYCVRSTGTLLLGSATAAPPAATPADRPFWASAGQDGDFTKGEDNVYSFQD